MIRYRHLLSLLFLFLMAACQKELSSEIPATIVPPVNTTAPTRLSKAFAIDTTLTAPFDTIGRESYFYDTQHRPLRIESVGTGASGNIESQITILYQYNGADTFASRTIENETYYPAGLPPETNTDTTDYIFLNGRCIYDSGYSFKAGVAYYMVNNYTYEPGNVIRISMKASTPDLTNRTIRQNIVNGLVLSQTDSSVSVFPVSGFNTANTSTLTYSDHPNPFAPLSDPIRRPYFNDDMGIGSRAAAPVKLFLQHVYTWKQWSTPGTPSMGERTAVYNYQFRADGYPVIAWETFPANNYRSKFIFIYE